MLPWRIGPSLRSHTASLGQCACSSGVPKRLGSAVNSRVQYLDWKNICEKAWPFGLFSGALGNHFTYVVGVRVEHGYYDSVSSRS